MSIRHWLRGFRVTEPQTRSIYIRLVDGTKWGAVQADFRQTPDGKWTNTKTITFRNMPAATWTHAAVGGEIFPLTPQRDEATSKPTTV